MLPVALNPCAVTPIVKFWGVALRPRESETITVIGNEPIAVGVPARVPPVAKLRPGGSGPVSLQVRGLTPSLAVNVNLYSRFTAPSPGEGMVLMEGGGGGGGAIVIAYRAFLCDAGDCESVTVMTTL